MMEEIRELAAEAKSVGLAVVIWSYPRGGKLDKAGETALDVCAYAAHMAALLGAHIIKVKLPTNVLWQPEAKAAYEKAKIDISTLAERIEHVVQATFNGRRIVVFSGGAAKDLEGLSRGRAAFATAAATARSSAATPSSARATRRSTCSTRSSASTRARCKRTYCPTD